jgi:hypothetical protein
MNEPAPEWEMVDELCADEEVLVLQNRLEWGKKATVVRSTIDVFCHSPPFL